MEILTEDEQAPASYPTAPSGLSTAASALDADALWQRIEQFITRRWNERQVVWIVEGPGVFAPRLQPATIDTREVWNGDSWESVTLDAAPLGDELDAKTYRFTATVGSTDDPPASINEAFVRLAEYLADQSFIGRVATSGTRDLNSTVQATSERPAAWQSKALYYSGAADLLRRYR